ncbi:MAG: SBBP repeat-containing protein, partial [Thermodesulfovibrionales bacterium]|nr:SBBP repeat-containing protein [Thermodesulfovibrionales bacterium]
SNGDLKYATNASGSWVISTLDDIAEKIFVTGYTHSTDFPVSESSADSTFTQYHDEGFTVKLNSKLSAFLATTYLGGSDDDYSYAIIPEGNGNVFLAGLTYSTDFPLPPLPFTPADSTFEGSNEGFIAKLDTDLNILLASTFLGGDNNDYPSSLVQDDTGNIYISGYTQSPDFPGIDAASADCDFGPYYEGFIAHLNANLDTSVLGATYLGGNNYDNANDIALDALGNVYAAGWTYSRDFPGISSGFADILFGGNNEGFIMKLTPGLTLLSMQPITMVRLTLPKSDRVVTLGSHFPITWQSNNSVNQIAKSKLYYQKNKTKWKHITTLQGSPGSYEWIVPNVLEENDKILLKIILKDKKGKMLGMDISDNYSVIQAAP